MIRGQGGSVGVVSLRTPSTHVGIKLPRVPTHGQGRSFEPRVVVEREEAKRCSRRRGCGIPRTPFTLAYQHTTTERDYD